MSSKKKSAEQLRAEIEALQNQIKEKSKQLRQEDKRKDARQKFLLGELMMEWVKAGKVREDELRAALETFLTRKEDRLLFGLEPDAKPVPVTPVVSNSSDTKPEKTSKKKPTTDEKTTSSKATKAAAPDTAAAKQTTSSKQSKHLQEASQANMAKDFNL